MSTKSTSGNKGLAKLDKPIVRRESLRSKLASIFGGKVDAADPNAEPIDAKDLRWADITEHATGESKLFLLAYENGVLDPYCNLPVERKGRGTKDNPVPIESFYNERAVACVCESTQSYVKYTILNKGEPKRCACGHWMELVDAPKFWLKIPKEDLVTIPYFAELEAEGKLDKILAGEDEEHHAHGGH